MIKAIVFDLWNTLAYNDGRNPILELKTRFNISDIKLIENAIEKQDFESTREMLEEFCRFFSIPQEPALIEELEQRFRLGMYSGKLFDDVLPVLKELRQKYRLGIISNTDTFSAQALSRTGLFKYFDEQCLSCDMGLIKPDKELFTLMAERLELNPNEILMVGDNISDDLMPAASVRFQTLLIRRNGEFIRSHSEAGEHKDTITKLKELKKFLK
jgi:HAD superfamily hydrolase (TIGR01549 family)